MVFPLVMYRCESWTIKKAEKVKIAQSCSTLCNPMDYTVHGILQARILKWVAYPSPADLPDPGIKLGSFCYEEEGTEKDDVSSLGF